MNSVKRMNLGAFIEALEKQPQDHTVYFEFACADPTTFDSYRGIYAHLALGFTGGYGAGTQKVSDLLAKAKACVGAEFEGWKGGEYTMGYETELWVANRGCTGDTAIVDVVDHGYMSLIVTARDPY